MKKPGRPTKKDKVKTRSLAFTDSEWTKLTLLGRAKWIRLKIKEELHEFTRTN
jgi:hypothetical protein